MLLAMVLLCAAPPLPDALSRETSAVCRSYDRVDLYLPALRGLADDCRVQEC